MSRVYDNWERLVGEVLKREQFREMALAPPSTDTSFSSRQSDLTSFASTNHHIDLAADGNTSPDAPSPRGVAARAALLFSAPLAYYRRRIRAEVYLGHLERFSLLELQVATDNFSDENILGRGGFGNVYKGILAGGTLVAVKWLTKDRTKVGDLQFQREMETISMSVHRNVLKLRGFCMTPTKMLLIYPYMVNESVASWLRERPKSQAPLVWPIRKRIALGSAGGLAYLHEHCDQKIIHCDIKAANILLDDDFEAVVGDFGLAKLMDHKGTHVVTDVVGTFGHIAPEYLSTGKISAKTDVYGYGVMLLELITGQKAYDVARVASDGDAMLLHWVKRLMMEKKLEMLVDRDLEGDYVDEEVEQLVQVALLCTQISPDERPSMSDVVGMLEGDGLAGRCDKWQKEERSDQNVNHIPHPNNNDWTMPDYIDMLMPNSTDNMRADELLKS